MNRKTATTRFLGASIMVSVMLALIAAFCMRWLSANGTNNPAATPAMAAPAVESAAATTPTENSDGTQRQTAQPWTGSAAQFEYPNRERTLQSNG
jgi:hypothetical protein